MQWKVPLFDTDFGQEEISSVGEVLQSGWLTMGDRVRRFEEDFARFTGAKHAVAVNNCTAGLHLAYTALGLGPGDDVICPSLTFVATSNAAIYAGARPVFADVADLDSWLVSSETIAAARTTASRAICVVHYAGYPCDMESICKYAKQEGLFVVEDCAHAPGASFDGKSVGCWGDIGCFSFFSNKNMSTGEGGMVTTNDDSIAERLRLLRSHGMTTLTLDRHKGHAFSYDVLDYGYNYRPTEITAALGMIQLQKLNRKNRKRAELTDEYRTLLRQILPEVRIPFEKHDPALSSCHLMPVLLPENVSRETIMTHLQQNGIQTSIHYRPIHTFSAYRDPCKVASPSPLINTETIGVRELTLPLYPAMDSGSITLVLETLAQALRS